MTRAEKAVSLMDRETRNWLLRNVKIKETDNPGIFITLTDSGYIMRLGVDFDDYNDAQRRIIVLHEIAHILRGDCLGHDNKLDHSLVNVSQDAIINAGFPDFLEVCGDGPPYYWTLQAMFDELPSAMIPAWRVIYEVLIKHGAPKMIGFDGPPKNSVKDRRKAEAAHAKAVIEAREIKSLKGLGAGHLVNFHHTGKVSPQPLPAWARLLGRINRQVRKNGFGSLVQVRTYNRPGRVEGLRGSARQPRLTIEVILDVSGSCAFLEPVFRGLAATLRRSYNVRLGLFADRFSEVKTPSSTPDVGGGTSIGPVMTALNKIKPDLAIILTDGEFFDDLKLPACPVWFVIYGSKPEWEGKLRSKDKLIMGKED